MVASDGSGNKGMDVFVSNLMGSRIGLGLGPARVSVVGVTVGYVGKALVIGMGDLSVSGLVNTQRIQKP